MKPLAQFGVVVVVAGVVVFAVLALLPATGETLATSNKIGDAWFRTSGGQEIDCGRPLLDSLPIGTCPSVRSDRLILSGLIGGGVALVGLAMIGVGSFTDSGNSP